MSSIFRHWKNRLRCSSKRYHNQSRSSVFTENDFKTVHITMDKLLNENQTLKERFDKLEERVIYYFYFFRSIFFSSSVNDGLLMNKFIY
jgi:hypothetical protein